MFPSGFRPDILSIISALYALKFLDTLYTRCLINFGRAQRIFQRSIHTSNCYESVKSVSSYDDSGLPNLPAQSKILWNLIIACFFFILAISFNQYYHFFLSIYLYSFLFRVSRIWENLPSVSKDLINLFSQRYTARLKNIGTQFFISTYVTFSLSIRSECFVKSNIRIPPQLDAYCYGA